MISTTRRKQLNKNDHIGQLFDTIGRKNDFLSRSPTNRGTYSASRKSRPVSKNSKRNYTAIPKKKRHSRANSMRREEIMKQYLGSTLKTDNFTSNLNSTQPTLRPKLNKTFHLIKSNKTSATNTPQLKKILMKPKKVNNFFVDFISPERSVKNSKDGKTKTLELGPFSHKKRDSHGSPIYLGMPQLEVAKKPIEYKIKSSFEAVEWWDNKSDKGSDYVPHYNEEKNIVTKFAFATRVGHMPNNPFKVNQDAFILAPNILNLQSMHYFGVWDGHGVYGKDVKFSV